MKSQVCVWRSVLAIFGVISVQFASHLEIFDLSEKLSCFLLLCNHLTSCLVQHARSLEERNKVVNAPIVLLIIKQFILNVKVNN